METIFSQKIHQFWCETCGTKCGNKKDFKKHIATRKHKTLTNGNKMETEIPQNVEKTEILSCPFCNKGYLSRTGLWKHKRKCKQIEEDANTIDGIDINDKDAIVMHLLKQNSELQNKLIEMTAHPSCVATNSNINSLNNSNNKTFNLQFFLNETCKDAMNISDFVKTIKVELNDLEHTGRTGYIQGITNIIIKNLDRLEKHMRPLHCSDMKREVFYIKDNNEWTKETNDKPILTKAVKIIANENIKQINKWRDHYPDCMSTESKKNELFLKIVSNSMNGLTKEEGNSNIHKIISNVAKFVAIDK